MVSSSLNVTVVVGLGVHDAVDVGLPNVAVAVAHGPVAEPPEHVDGSWA